MDSLVWVLLTSRNHSMASARRQMVDLRASLRRIEQTLDGHSGQSTGAGNEKHAMAAVDKRTVNNDAVMIREPMSQQTHKQQVGV